MTTPPHFFSDVDDETKKLYDQLSEVADKVDDILELLADKIREPGIRPSTKQMNDELRYIQWRDEILQLHNAGILVLPGDDSKK